MTILNALLPVFLVILVGVGLKRVNLMSEEQWHGFESLTYYVFFPCLLFYTIIKADLDAAPIGEVALILFAATVLNMGLSWATRPLIVDGSKEQDKSFTSLFQGSSRWNSFAALGIAASLIGPQGSTLIAVAFVAMIPVLNFFCVIVLAIYAGDGKPNLVRVAKEIGKNPFIIAIILGVVFKLMPFSLPIAIVETLRIIGVSGLGAALIIVGVGLKLRSLRTPNRFVILAIIFKLIVVPALGLAGAQLLGLGLIASQSIIIALGVPTAAASYVLARKMGGDAPLMATILTMQTFVSFITLPAWLYFVAALYT